MLYYLVFLDVILLFMPVKLFSDCIFLNWVIFHPMALGPQWRTWYYCWSLSLKILVVHIRWTFPSGSLAFAQLNNKMHLMDCFLTWLISWSTSPMKTSNITFLAAKQTIVSAWQVLYFPSTRSRLSYKHLWSTKIFLISFMTPMHFS